MNLDGRDLTELLLHPESRSWDEKPVLQTYTGNIYGEKQLIEELKKARKTGEWENSIPTKQGSRPG